MCLVNHSNMFWTCHMANTPHTGASASTKHWLIFIVCHLIIFILIVCSKTVSYVSWPHKLKDDFQRSPENVQAIVYCLLVQILFLSTDLRLRGREIMFKTIYISLIDAILKLPWKMSLISSCIHCPGQGGQEAGEYDEKSIRYTGKSIPSRSFRLLQSMTGGEDPLPGLITHLSTYLMVGHITWHDRK